MATDLSMVNLLDVLYSLQNRGTRVKRTSTTRGGNYNGPCPTCGGKDRLYILPNAISRYTGLPEGKWACRNCHPKESDALEMLVYFDGLTYAEAFKRLRELYPDLPNSYGYTGKGQQPAPVRIKPMEDTAKPPVEQWQLYAKDFLLEAQKCLWSQEGREALAYLRDVRKLTDETIKAAGLGFCPQRGEKHFIYEPPHLWGLDIEDYPKGVYVPSGILFPYWYKDDLWKLRIRRLGDDIPKDKRYSMISGGSNGLYEADSIQAGQPVVLLEGEIDALSVKQAMGGSVACVATGSTTQARISLWYTRLVLASTVLICFDNDENTAEAIQYWTDRIERARVHIFPTEYKDANVMLQEGGDIVQWVKNGLADPLTQLARTYITQLQSGTFPDGDERSLDFGCWNQTVLDIEHLFWQVERQCRRVKVIGGQVIPYWKGDAFHQALAEYTRNCPEMSELGLKLQPFGPVSPLPVDPEQVRLVERLQLFRDLGIRFSVEHGKLIYEADFSIGMPVCEFFAIHEQEIMAYLRAG